MQSSTLSGTSPLAQGIWQGGLAYIRVSGSLVGHIDLHDSDTAIALGKAMTRFENGVQPYSDDVWAGPQEPKSSGRY